jgi:multicomponent Na+:H+ antiporter subunit F
VSAVLGLLVLFLVATVLASLWRVAAGPTPADRLLAPQLLGTTGIAALLVAAEWLATPSLRDVALVLALLAFATTAAFALRAWGTGAGGEGGR